MNGPTLAISQELHAMKYRSEGETFREAMTRIADALKDDEAHFEAFREILLDMRVLPAGRVQAAMGAPRAVTPYNCFVSGVIPDSMNGIMKMATEAAETMRMGGGIGYDFSTLRPRGDLIRSLDSRSSGPVSFMSIFDAVCGTIASAGHRRGAQMGVLRVDHPDIEEFVRCKQNADRLRNFNISVGVTDEFMEAVIADRPFDLRWMGRVYKTVSARKLWDEIMRSTWTWAEPGVLFLDTANRMNNLHYCETLAATNPCAEQWLPPYGACLLGSFNLTRYMLPTPDGGWTFSFDLFRRDIPVVVRAMDNIVDRAIYPLDRQELEARRKRRMGLGVTGLANAIEAWGGRYGGGWFCQQANLILRTLTIEAYRASVELAKEKGPFPYFMQNYCESGFVQRLPQELQDAIRTHGIRNSHLTSIAPTGTISLTADNVSSGIEPVFSYGYDRVVQHFDGPKVERVEDYGVRVFGVRGKTADQCTIDDHLNVLAVASRWSDSSVSKTCNIGDDVTWEEFKEVYLKAWKMGAKGCTTFRAAGKRSGILIKKDEEAEGAACYFDPETGKKSCE
jgi:ribonucleoside-diphosphate reductase alpha chain